MSGPSEKRMPDPFQAHRQAKRRRLRNQDGSAEYECSTNSSPTGSDLDEDQDSNLARGSLSSKIVYVRPRDEPKTVQWVTFKESYSKEWYHWWEYTTWVRNNPDINISWITATKGLGVWEYFDGVARIPDGFPSLLCTRCNKLLVHNGIKKTGTNHLNGHLKTELCKKAASASGLQRITQFTTKQSEKVRW